MCLSKSRGEPASGYGPALNLKLSTPLAFPLTHITSTHHLAISPALSIASKTTPVTSTKTMFTHRLCFYSTNTTTPNSTPHTPSSQASTCPEDHSQDLHQARSGGLINHPPVYAPFWWLYTHHLGQARTRASEDEE
ncbi:hypothetical protein BD410DRAFT_792332 [Rickenella mellea]|uniref:Uncharacterized protein n=1 Tax=Rickenella mellea TaxID=50990 RepID=A0A4Y7PW89_9AGAM|nr:hypothetical protein BD410DRAFT_792332 [Rickenella mellea]